MILILHEATDAFGGRQFEGLEDLNARRWAWLQAANPKPLATTGRVPSDLLPAEGFSPWAVYAPGARPNAAPGRERGAATSRTVFNASEKTIHGVRVEMKVGT